MATHGVLRPHRQSDDVPAALQGLPRPRLGPALLLAHRLHGPGQLRDGRDVDDQHAAGYECGSDGLEHLPRRQHVEDRSVDLGRS